MGLLLLWLPAAGRADQLLDVHLDDKVPVGKSPTLVVTVHRDLTTLTLDLRRDDGKVIHQTIQNVPRGGKRSFELPQGPGTRHYQGNLTAGYDGDQGSMILDFRTEVVSTLGLEVRREDLDLEAHVMLLRAKRPLARVEYEITGEDGSLLGRGVEKTDRNPDPIRIGWTQKPGPILRIRLTAHDNSGIFEDLELVPWSYVIPHEEVEFETGKSEIRTGEGPKLDRSYELLQRGLSKYGHLLEVKLFVAGYTDTVAAAETNQELSEKRALSIASYFRGKGFQHPIFYQGFGERGLKVPTPDEIDEPKNRRAQYVLAAEPPPMDVPNSASHWKPLP